MMLRPAFAILAAACALTLGACSKQADNGATPPPGATGQRSSDAGPAAPGTGLNGGMSGTDTAVAGSTPAGTGTSASMGAGPATSGSTNTTTGSSVGNRP